MKASIRDIAAIRTLLAAFLKATDPFAALSSLGPDNIAHVRQVVIRGYDPAADTLWITTHIHSEKVKHLRKYPQAQLSIWIAPSRIQLRLLAAWRAIDATLADRNANLRELRKLAWNMQSPAVRQSFFWPDPGLPFTRKSKSKTKIPASDALPEDPPPAFALMLGTLELIDALRLTKPTHERYLHTRLRNHWDAQRITP
jgi:hypothetical protein